MKKLLLFVFFYTVACNKSPVGQDELDQRGNFNAQTINLPFSASVTETKSIALGNSVNLVLGKNADYEARVILKFTFPDTIPNGAKDIRLVLTRNKNLNRDTLRFSIHLITSDFTELDATWSKRNADEAWTVAGGDFENDSLRYVVFKEDSLVVPFNYAELTWMKNSKGVIFVPRDSGFGAWYAKEGGNAPQLRMTVGTTVTTIALAADLFIVRGPSPSYYDPWIGAGVPYRNYVKFKFFNHPDTFPDSTLFGKKCLYGELTFGIESHFALRESLDIGIKPLTEPLNGFDTDVGSLVAFHRIAAGDTSATVDIIQYVQKVIDHPDSNFGFFIFLSPDNYDIANLKIRRGSYRLKVGYIDPPGERQ
jgi:hypothetical protein